MRFCSEHSGSALPVLLHKCPLLIFIYHSYQKGNQVKTRNLQTKQVCLGYARAPKTLWKSTSTFFCRLQRVCLTQENQFHPIEDFGTVRPNKGPIHMTSCSFLKFKTTHSQTPAPFWRGEGCSSRKDLVLFMKPCNRSWLGRKPSFINRKAYREDHVVHRKCCNLSTIFIARQQI